MDILVREVAERLSIEDWSASNRFVFDAHDRLERIVAPLKDEDDKLFQLKAFCQNQNIRLTDCVVIGDGANDRKLFEATGHGITFSDSPITDIAWKTIDTL